MTPVPSRPNHTASGATFGSPQLFLGYRSDPPRLWETPFAERVDDLLAHQDIKTTAAISGYDPLTGNRNR